MLKGGGLSRLGDCIISEDRLDGIQSFGLGHHYLWPNRGIGPTYELIFNGSVMVSEFFGLSRALSSLL